MENDLILGLVVLSVATVVILLRWLPFRQKGSRRVKQSSGGAGSLSRRDYMVTFDAGNTRLELYVTQSDFALLKEGAEGQLTWQRQTLLSFEPSDA